MKYFEKYLRVQLNGEIAEVLVNKRYSLSTLLEIGDDIPIIKKHVIQWKTKRRF